MTITLSASGQAISTVKELVTTSYALRQLARQHQASGLDYSPQLQELGFTADYSKLDAKPIVRLVRTTAGLHLTLGAFSKPVVESVRAAA